MPKARKREREVLAIAHDGTNEATLQQHGFSTAMLDALVTAGHLRVEPRRYGARGSTRLDLTVRRFYLTPAGQAALANNGESK